MKHSSIIDLPDAKSLDYFYKSKIKCCELMFSGLRNCPVSDWLPMFEISSQNILPLYLHVVGCL